MKYFFKLDEKLFYIIFGLALISTNSVGQWENVNSLYGADVLALVVNGANLYAGTDGAGVFFSNNNGASWTSINYGLIDLHIHALALGPDGKGGVNLFAGTERGVYLLNNAGALWVSANNGINNFYVSSLSVCPNAVGGNNIFAGTNGGLFLSTDNGINWTNVSSGMAYPYVNVVISIPNESGGMNYFAGSSEGLFLSTNNGDDWTAIMSNRTVSALAISGSNLYLGSTFDGVFLSTDNGTSWTKIDSGLTNSRVNSLTVSENYLFAGTEGGIFLSTNNGTSWDAVNSGLTRTVVRDIAINESNLFAGTYGGIYKSSNNGSNWTAINSGLANVNVNCLAVSPNVKGVAGGRLFAGTKFGIYTSSDNGNSWIADSFVTGDIRIFAVGYNSGISKSNYILAGTTDVFFSTNNGINWTAINSGLPGYGLGSLAIIPAIDSGGCTYLFAGYPMFGIFRSSDNGGSWSAFDSGLTSTSVSCLAADPYTAGGTNLFACISGNIFHSSNDYTYWTKVGSSIYFNNLIVSPDNNGGANLFGINVNGIFQSTNYGIDWTSIYSDWDNSYIRRLAVIGNNIFVGTGGQDIVRGSKWGRIVLSTTNGSSWEEVNLGWYQAPVGDIVFVVDSLMSDEPNIFVIIEGGVWRRPLSEVVASVSTNNQVLLSKYNLSQNYPNPFNPTTNIQFSLLRSGFTTLKIYNVLGEEVATLINGDVSAGRHKAEWNATGFSSGVYFYRLQTENYSETKKLVLLR